MKKSKAERKVEFKASYLTGQSVVVIMEIKRLEFQPDESDTFTLKKLLGIKEEDEGGIWYLEKGDPCMLHPYKWGRWLESKIRKIACPGDRTIFYLKPIKKQGE